MRKLISIMAGIMILLSGTGCMAAEGLEAAGVMVSEDGNLNAVICGLPESAAASGFSAFTENGNLEAVQTVPYRETETSWFFIYDNAGDTYIGIYSPKVIREKEKKVIVQAAEMVRNGDSGALVFSSSQPSVTVREADDLIETVNQSEYAGTGAEYLPQTLEHVISYIRTHREELRENVMIMVVTDAYFAYARDPAFTGRISSVLQDNADITTYMICVVGSQRNYSPDWVKQAGKLAGLGEITAGGTGYSTAGLHDDQIDLALQRVRAALGERLRLELRPVSADSVGKEITVSCGGASLSIRLDEGSYEKWLSRWTPVYHSGDEVTVHVKLNIPENGKQVIAAEAALNYDHSVFRLTDTPSVINDRFILYSRNGIQPEETVALTFTVLQTAKPGTYTIGAETVSALDTDDQEVSGIFFTGEEVTVR